MATTGRKPMQAERRAKVGRISHSTPAVRVVAGQPIDVTEPPAGLGEAGRRLFADVLTRCRSWLQPSDLITLHEMCRLADDIDRQHRQVLAEGDVLAGRGGKVQAHPLLAHIRDARKQLHGLLASFGLSPTERARFAVVAASGMSKFELLKARRDGAISSTEFDARMQILRETAADK